jgi:drug/metabolite transporter (DMT)-like permease
MASPPSLAAPARLDPGLGLALLALGLGAVAMGVSPVFVRVANAEVGPFASAFWRVGLALPLLYAWTRFEERGARETAERGLTGRRASRRIEPVLVGAGLVFAGDLFFWHLAILATTVANATFFATTAPVFVVLVAWAALGRRPQAATLAGLALCLAGGAALVWQSLAVEPGRLAGDLYGIATALFFGLYFLVVERARARGIGAARVTFVASAVTAAVLLAVALAIETRPILPATLSGAAALAAMAWISHAGGQGLLSVALGRLPAAFSALVIFLEAIFAALFAWALLGEAVSPLQGLGGALILVGIAVARPRRAAPARPEGGR